MPPKVVLFQSVFFFSVHFSFCVAIKKKSEHEENISARYSYNIIYVKKSPFAGAFFRLCLFSIA